MEERKIKFQQPPKNEEVEQDGVMVTVDVDVPVYEVDVLVDVVTMTDVVVVVVVDTELVKSNRPESARFPPRRSASCQAEPSKRNVGSMAGTSGDTGQHPGHCNGSTF